MGERDMPTVETIGNIRIVIRTADHNPPHVHAISPDGDAKIAIETGEILFSAMKSKPLARAKAWVLANQDLLRSRWVDIHETEED